MRKLSDQLANLRLFNTPDLLGLSLLGKASQAGSFHCVPVRPAGFSSSICPFPILNFQTQTQNRDEELLW